jgi:hypothetical protein
MHIMKRILFAIFLIAVSFTAFAFEGVIKQEVLNPSTGDKSIVTWYIKGDKIKMVIDAKNEKMILVPELSRRSLIMFSEKADEQGEKWYFEASTAQIQAKQLNMNVIEKTAGTFKNEKTEVVKAVSNEGLHKVDFLPSVDILFGKYAELLKENPEAQIASLAGIVGFPVSSTLTTSKGELQIIKTLSIDTRKIEDAEFGAPKGFKKFDPSALKFD